MFSHWFLELAAFSIDCPWDGLELNSRLLLRGSLGMQVVVFPTTLLGWQHFSNTVLRKAGTDSGLLLLVTL